MKHKQAYATSTARVIQQMDNTTNPVTRASYREIIGNRIDRLELHRLKQGKSDERR